MMGVGMLTAAELYLLHRVPSQIHVSPIVSSLHPFTAPVSAQDNVVALIPARNKEKNMPERLKCCTINYKS